MNKHTSDQTGEGNAPRGQKPIQTCSGVNREQAFRRGSYLIGYGATASDAIENLIAKESR